MAWRLSGLLFLLSAPVIAWANASDGGVGHKQWTKRYDPYFKKYTKRYFGPGVDWRWFKAQGIAESGLKAKARSRSGAVGIMQILPSTFGDIKKKNPTIGALAEPRWNIAAGIYYDRHLYQRWRKRLVYRERFPFMFGSYNAGLGNINKAWRKAKRKRRKVARWPEVEPYVPKETRRYVKRIRGLMKAHPKKQ
ncbi:MAG TPA: murein transglycosylase [Chromatiaceae bacterium]|nr:murein transglycosylase [Chromatiaceae bacterium]